MPPTASTVRTEHKARKLFTTSLQGSKLFTCVSLTTTWYNKICDLQQTSGISPTSISALLACHCYLQRGTRLNNWTVNRRFMKRPGCQSAPGPRCATETAKESNKLIHIYCLITSLYTRAGKGAVDFNPWVELQLTQIKNKVVVVLELMGHFKCSFDANSGELTLKFKK